MVLVDGENNQKTETIIFDPKTMQLKIEASMSCQIPNQYSINIGF